MSDVNHHALEPKIVKKTTKPRSFSKAEKNIKAFHRLKTICMNYDPFSGQLLSLSDIDFLLSLDFPPSLLERQENFPFEITNHLLEKISKLEDSLKLNGIHIQDLHS